MQAPDGEVLCYCDSKKMNWYISRGLAKLVSEDPCVFKLIFEPNARGCKDEADIELICEEIANDDYENY